MSRPPVNPEKSLAGITVDPISLERVIPESKRPDGTVRKQLKIRPGFTPQEDVRRFRGTKQAQMDVNTLPKGHIIGWSPPPGASNTPKPGTTDNSNQAASSSSTTPMTKAAKKNAKRKEKREKEKVEKEKDIPDDWEDDDEQVEENKTTSDEKGASVQRSVEDNLSSQLEELDVN